MEGTPATAWLNPTITVDEAETLLKNGISPKFDLFSSQTPLSMAIKHRNTAVALLIIANLNSFFYETTTLFNDVIEMENFAAILGPLLHRGFRIYIWNFLPVVLKNRLDVAKFLLEYKTVGTNDYREFFLHVCSDGTFEMVKLFIDYGVTPRGAVPWDSGPWNYQKFPRDPWVASMANPDHRVFDLILEKFGPVPNPDENKPRILERIRSINPMNLGKLSDLGLLEINADIGDGNRLLHFFVTDKRPGAFETLLEVEGLNPRVYNSTSLSPFDFLSSPSARNHLGYEEQKRRLKLFGERFP